MHKWQHYYNVLLGIHEGNEEAERHRGDLKNTFNSARIGASNFSLLLLNGRSFPKRKGRCVLDRITLPSPRQGRWAQASRTRREPSVRPGTTTPRGPGAEPLPLVSPALIGAGSQPPCKPVSDWRGRRGRGVAPFNCRRARRGGCRAVGAVRRRRPRRDPRPGTLSPGFSSGAPAVTPPGTLPRPWRARRSAGAR